MASLLTGQQWRSSSAGMRFMCLALLFKSARLQHNLDEIQAVLNSAKMPRGVVSMPSGQQLNT
jgi:hypothetical protein